MAALLDEDERVVGRVWGGENVIPGGIFVGPLEVGTTQEKGRGLFATRDIFPGELLLAEECLFEPSGGRPPEVAGTIVALRAKQNDVNSPIWAALQGLRPSELSQVSNRSIAEARDKFGTALMFHEEGYEERLRLALRIQSNNFSGQIFPRQSLFNHSCRNANAVRIDGLSGFGSFLLFGETDRLNSRGYAEIYATRHVKAGEELSINYDELESASSRRRERLRKRYDFECSCCASPNEDEVIVEDDLERVQETDAAQCALERAIGLLGQNSPVVLRARRLVVKLAESDDDKPGLVAKCLLLRNIEMQLLGPRHLAVAKTDLIAADSIEAALLSWKEIDENDWLAVLSLGADVEKHTPQPVPFNTKGSMIAERPLFEKLEDLEFRLRLHAESIAHLYRESRARNLDPKVEEGDGGIIRASSPTRPSQKKSRIPPRLASRYN